jgi:hypothetical protein
MLHEFLTNHRQELIRRCIGKAAKRDRTRVVALKVLSEPDHGVPLFLQQLVDVLRAEQARPGGKGSGTSGSSAASLAEGTRTAALHGKALLDDGYTVDQVVHGYGDVCQSITELAGELRADVTLAEFHTLNRMLDNAIADAVSSYARHRDHHSATGAEDLHDRMGSLADELRVHVNAALKAMEALKVANIGVNGATGSLLNRSLVNLRDLIDKSLPEIRLATGMTSPAAKLER